MDDLGSKGKKVSRNCNVLRREKNTIKCQNINIVIEEASAVELYLI